MYPSWKGREKWINLPINKTTGVIKWWKYPAACSWVPGTREGTSDHPQWTTLRPPHPLHSVSGLDLVSPEAAGTGRGRPGWVLGAPCSQGLGLRPDPQLHQSLTQGHWVSKRWWISSPQALAGFSCPFFWGVLWQPGIDYVSYKVLWILVVQLEKSDR